ncbi:hypothetical protein VTN31DRAFT_4548 [Thermomyces dupontii]|uniref:uncharacterized protein n=1 Tax=Talaromyces thermophilus TaxID=28565 RepID=UPI0037445B0E
MHHLLTITLPKADYAKIAEHGQYTVGSAQVLYRKAIRRLTEFLLASTNWPSSRQRWRGWQRGQRGHQFPAEVVAVLPPSSKSRGRAGDRKRKASDENANTPSGAYEEEDGGGGSGSANRHVDESPCERLARRRVSSRGMAGYLDNQPLLMSFSFPERDSLIVSSSNQSVDGLSSPQMDETADTPLLRFESDSDP